MDSGGKCASEVIQMTLRSALMMFNHIFILLVITASFFVNVFTVKKLYNHNIFPEGTRILLWSAIGNGCIHQITVAEIRLITIYRVLVHGSDRCTILFPSSGCVYEQYFYYYTNFFTSFCCISLFFDRLLSTNCIAYQYKYKFFVMIFLTFQTILPLFILIWVYSNGNTDGYVAMCNYPPMSVAWKYFYINRLRLVILGTFFILSICIFYYNKNVEKKIIHKIYDTVSRYKSYENVLATKAVCIIIVSQTACLVITATGTEQIRKFFSPTMMDPLTGFMTGVTYCNFCLPIIILYQTSQIIQRRKRAIHELTDQTKDSSNEHFISLRNAWNHITKT
ncbi:Protein CBR-SRA-31 [Caenorhabditis briggsae]|uniref:Protein CBR-SRA-31 n=1 Tax=Caenorhabditis briggsae TaxID=6238 RepID=A8WX91_CAEBR|nr:Protein CBR-SRA-31 [Caenorhabditis briggsae]CAP25055.1 Protein CBR-SRA-31 [Caenorhabditis briggsae]